MALEFLSRKIEIPLGLIEGSFRHGTILRIQSLGKESLSRPIGRAFWKCPGSFGEVVLERGYFAMLELWIPILARSKVGLCYKDGSGWYEVD